MMAFSSNEIDKIINLTTLTTSEFKPVFERICRQLEGPVCQNTLEVHALVKAFAARLVIEREFSRYFKSLAALQEMANEAQAYGLYDGPPYSVPKAKRVATFQGVVKEVVPGPVPVFQLGDEDPAEESDSEHPMRKPQSIYKATSNDDEGESVAARNPALKSVGFMAAHAAAEKLHSMGYRWEWNRSVDADGNQEGAWVKCEGDAAP